MRVVLQRVSKAEVRAGGELAGSIGRGFLLLVGLHATDGEKEIAWMAEKIAGLRVFEDDDGRMNLPLAAVSGRCLCVSQFTLAGDASRGRRPSFDLALAPERAAPLFERFVELLARRVGPVETGQFGAKMEVLLVNDGPVTIVLERHAGEG